MNVWIAACLVIPASVIVVTMTGNNCEYHFHGATTQTGVLEMLECDARRSDGRAECDIVSVI